MAAMPVEPPPCPWRFPDFADAVEEAEFPDDLVGHGADLKPGTLLAAYRSGVFPMPVAAGGARRLAWWAPRDRGVLPLPKLRVSRSLARSCRRMEIRVDTAFEEVVAGCGHPSREGGWIDAEVASAYTALHRLGWAHSVEAWRDGELAGGLYGVAVGGLFAGESMFHRVRDASKVALVGLVDLLSDEYAEARLVDVQWQTPHLASLGAIEVPRPTYTRLLRAALQIPLPDPWG